MLRSDRKQQNSVEQLSFNKKNKLKKMTNGFQHLEYPIGQYLLLSEYVYFKNLSPK